MARRSVGKFLSDIESRWSLLLLLQSSGLLAGFALPAWAVNAANIFSEYSPVSWLAAGFAGLFLTLFCMLVWEFAVRLKIRSQYDARLLSAPSLVNPLDKTFEGKRIYINEFVLPSHTRIEGKTFIDCEIVGPANIYWFAGNQAQENKLPKMDAVFLDPKKLFFNGILLKDCIFRGCSFQRITVFIGAADYDNFKNVGLLNWISLTPDSMPELPFNKSDPGKDEHQNADASGDGQ